MLLLAIEFCSPLISRTVAWRPRLHLNELLLKCIYLVLIRHIITSQKHKIDQRWLRVEICTRPEFVHWPPRDYACDLDFRADLLLHLHISANINSLLIFFHLHSDNPFQPCVPQQRAYNNMQFLRCPTTFYGDLVMTPAARVKGSHWSDVKQYC